MSDAQSKKIPPSWRTTDAALALALITAGVPHAEPFTVNLYTPETLAKLGFKKASEAESAGVPGTVTYFFQRTPELDRLVKAWQKQNEIIAKLDKGEPVKEREADIDIDGETLMRVAAQLLKNRKAVVNAWKAQPAILAVKDGPKQFRIISTNASAETKRRLGFSA